MGGNGQLRQQEFSIMISRILIALLAFASSVHAGYVLRNPNIIVSSDSATESVILADSPAGGWTAVSNAPLWLNLASGNSLGIGSQVIVFNVAANPGATRTGTITIAGQTLTVTQASSDYVFVNRPILIGGEQVDSTYPAGGLALTPAGDLYIPVNSGQDYSGAGMKKWTASTNSFSADLAPSSIAYAGGAAIDASGNVFIAQNLAIKKFIVGPPSSIDDFVHDNSPHGTLYPHSSGVAFDSNGDLWVTVGSPSNKLKKVPAAGGAPTDILPFITDPGGIAIDALDNIYVADYDYSGLGRVRRIPAGTTTATPIITGVNFAFNVRLAVAVDGSGHVYATDPAAGQIYKWNAVTGAVTTVAASQLPGPDALASDDAGNLFIGNSDRTVKTVPRVLMLPISSAKVNLPLTAGSTVLTSVIPTTAADRAPFAPVSDRSWVTFTNVGGVITYFWEASTSPRYANISFMGQTILLQQGTPLAPTITTPTNVYPSPTITTADSATFGANITSDGGSPIITRGFVYAPTAVNANPTSGDPGVMEASASTNDVGVFTMDFYGLAPGTTYSVRAYAVNVVGITYTSTVSTFTTSPFDPSLAIGLQGPGKTTALQPDGKMLVGSVSPMFFNQGVNRYDTAGSPDNFYPGVDGTVNAVVPLESGQILVAGSFTSLMPASNPQPVTRNNTALLNNDGTLDNSVVPGANGTIRCMALQRDGSILIGGDFTQFNGVARNSLARIYANGTLDLTFNPSTNGPVRSVVQLPDGMIVIGGDFTLVGATVCNRLARLSLAGVVDMTFVASADAAVNVIALQPDNSILIGGGFGRINNIAHTCLARLNPNGTLDNSFATTANDVVNSIALQADGKIIIVGTFTSVASSARLCIARLLVDGSLDAFSVNVVGIDINTSQPKPAIINSVMLQENGEVVFTGDFNSVGGFQANDIARLANDPVVQTLAPAGSTSIEWQRGSTLPEALDVAFDLSTDGGTTWTLLGNGTRIAGGWSLTGLTTPLPASAQLRGRARTVSGLGNVSMGWNIVEAPYSLAAQKIVVEQPENTSRTSGDSIDLGTLGLNVPMLTSFIVRNSGGFDLTGINVTVSGANAAMFTVTTKPATSLGSLDSTECIVQAKLTSSGAKAATINIASNDANENPFVINLTATGAAAVLPVVTTTAATAVSYTTATVNGTVDAKGSPRDVFFDYGLTTTYTDTAAGSPATTSASGNVSAALTGLLPHTTYHFRARAAGGLGNATGVDKTFITLNNLPVANADSAVVLPGATASIDVLSNDTDADGDALTITTTAPVSPLTAGTVAITANQVVFTAKDTFTGTATVNYTIKDGFGGTATATLTITAGGTPSLTTSQAMPLDAAAISYPLTITTAGSWSVSESLAWASVSQTKGTGTTTIQISVQANATTAQRSGVIKIGGVIHHVVQNGVVKPSFGALAGSPFSAIVGGSFQLALPIQNAPVTYTTTGLPPGLTLSNTTNMITGRPTMAGSTATNYTVVVKASNAAGPLATDTAGKAATTLTFVIHVDPLPAGAVGAFSGYIDRSPTARFTADANLGARFDMTTTALGTVTGSVTEGATKKSFTGGQIIAVLGTPNTYSLTVALTGTPLYLDVTFDTDHNKATGVLRDVSGLNSAALHAWRNTWIPAKATIYKAQHNFRLTNGSTTDGPQGYGFGSFIVTETTGALVITGKLADGSAITTSTFVGPVGDVVLYQALYSNHGSCLGAMTIGTGSAAPAYNTVAGTLTWSKPASPAAAKDTVYAAGFPLLSLDVAGGAFFPPAKGGLLVATVNQADNAQLDLGTAGADTPSSPFLRISNPNATSGTTNVATFSATNPDHAAMPVLTFGTGLFSGSFSLAGTPARPAPFFGQIVPISGAYQGYGYYLLPSVPGLGQTVATSPKLSGTAWLISH